MKREFRAWYSCRTYRGEDFTTKNAARDGIA